MRERLQSLFDVVRSAAQRFSEDGASFLAQAIAFNAIFAAIPLALVIAAMFGYIFGSAEGSARAISAINHLSPQIAALVSNHVHSMMDYRGISGVVGLAGLVWSAKNVFGAISYGLGRSLDVPNRHWAVEALIAVVLVPLVGIALLVATIVPVAISLVVRFAGLEYLRLVPQIASYAVSLGLIFITSALIYTYLPNHRAPLSFGVPGAIVAALGYSITQVGFGIYVAHANFAKTYGALSAVFIVMFWVYLVSMIFLFGAHVSAQWATRGVERTVPERVATAATLVS